MIDLSVSKGKSNKIKVPAEMAKRFGESLKFEGGALSDKKIGMFSKTRKQFLIEL